MGNQWKSNQNVITPHTNTSQTEYKIEITTMQNDWKDLNIYRNDTCKLKNGNGY